LFTLITPVVFARNS